MMGLTMVYTFFKGKYCKPIKYVVNEYTNLIIIGKKFKI